MQTIVVDIYDPNISLKDATKAMGRVWEGRVKSPAECDDPEIPFDSDVHEQWINRLVAQGRGVVRLREKEGGHHATWLTLIRHPDLAEGEVYAIRHSRVGGYGNVYRCREADARICLACPGAYNL